MSRGYFNWTYDDVMDFLKRHHFGLNHIKGSHHFFAGNFGGQFRQVCVPFHGAKETIKPRTLKGIIRQSGIPKEKWIDK